MQVGWARNYQEQIQWVVRVSLEPGIIGSLSKRPNHWATLQWLLLYVNNCSKNVWKCWYSDYALALRGCIQQLWPSLLPPFMISFVSDKSSTLCMICAWKINLWRRQYDFLSDTVIFDFQSKRNRSKYSKISHLWSLWRTLDLYRCSLWLSASWLKLPRTLHELGEQYWCHLACTVKQYRFHLARSVEQIEIPFPYTRSINLHINYWKGCQPLRYWDSK